MEKDKIGVHRTHCCKVHGCKYGDEDCPVITGVIQQSYACELGGFMGEECFPKEKVEITRVEVIHALIGRVYVHWGDQSKVTYELQDEGRTLKVFINKK
jgi:hypothetical protein